MRILHITKTYEDKKVLDFDGMEIQKGKIYAIIGANGSGKSTMAKLLSGIEKADNGAVFDEKVNVGYMPQKSFAFSMSVKKNVLLNGEDKEKAESLLKKINMWDMADANAKKLSGGETSRMALARIMMKDYDVLILDEPTASMDMESTLIAEDMIMSYRKKTDAAVILITHSISQAKRTADEIVFMCDGKAEEKGPAKDIIASPKNEKTRKFLEFYGI